MADAIPRNRLTKNIDGANIFVGLTARPNGVTSSFEITIKNPHAENFFIASYRFASQIGCYEDSFFKRLPGSIFIDELNGDIL